jgi:hypothetical protein
MKSYNKRVMFMKRKKIKINFIPVGGDIEQVLDKLIRIELDPILSKYNAKIYNSHNLSNSTTGETCYAEHNEKGDVRQGIDNEGFAKG